MSIATALVAKLSTLSAVTALVGTSIYPEHAAADVFPRLLYTVDHEETTQTHDGPSGLMRAEFTISINTRTYTDCDTLKPLVRAGLDWVWTGYWAGAVIQRCYYNELEEGEITPVDLGELGQAFFVDLRFEVWFSQS